MLTIKADHSPDGETVTISGNLTVEHASKIKRAIEDALSSPGKNIILSLGTVTKTDVTFFQVACSAHKTAITLGKSFRIDQFQQEVLMRAHRTMGFTRRVGCALDKEKSCVFVRMSVQGDTCR